MRVLTWAMDAWRTPAGKVISVILSFALVFSMSNVIAYAADGDHDVVNDNQLSISEKTNDVDVEKAAEETPETKVSKETSEFDEDSDEQSVDENADDPKTDEESGTIREEDELSDPKTSEDTFVAEVELQLIDATITHDGKEYKDEESLKISAEKPFEFSVNAAKDSKIQVGITLENGVEKTLEPTVKGTYKISTKDIEKGLSVIAVVAEGVTKGADSSKTYEIDESYKQELIKEYGPTQTPNVIEKDLDFTKANEYVIDKKSDGLNTSKGNHVWDIIVGDGLTTFEPDKSQTGDTTFKKEQFKGNGTVVLGYYSSDKNGNKAELFQIVILNVTVGKTYTVYYDLNGGVSGEDDEKTLHNDLLIGDDIPTISDPIRNGYVFKGWKNLTTGSVQSKEEIASAKISGNVTYVAQWSSGIVVRANSDSFIYDGQSHQVTGLKNTTFTIGEDTYEVSGLSATSTNEKNAGTYDVVISGTPIITKISGTSSEEVTQDIDIELINGKMTITPVTDELVVKVTGNKATETYNGTEQSVTGFTTDAPESVKVELAEGKAAEAKGTDAGTYRMKLAAADFVATSDNYTNIKVEVVDGALEITPAVRPSSHLISVKSYNDVFDGAPHGVEIDGLFTNDTVQYSFDGESWSTIVPSRTNVQDEETVYVKVTNPNYIESSDNGTIKITPAPVTITVADRSMHYGEDAPSYDGEVEGLFGDDDLEVVYKYDGNNKESELAVGTYEKVITADYAPNDNYDVTIKPGNLTVLDSDKNYVNATGVYTTYDGNDYTISATAGIEGSEIQYSLDKENWNTQKPIFKDAGTYTVYVRAKAANYKITDPETATVTIAKRAAVITVSNASKNIGDDDPKFTGTVSNLVKSGDLGKISYYRTNKAQRTGTYRNVLNARYTENNNYTVTVERGNFTIIPAPNPPQAGDGAGDGGDGAPVPAAVPGAAPAAAPVAAPAAAVIPDDANPLAAPADEGTDESEEATIADDENPMGAFDSEPECWVHTFMIIGIIITLIYGGIVIARRLNSAKEIENMDKTKGSARRREYAQKREQYMGA